MSYRLIDANALAASCKQVDDMPCIYADLPNGLDGGHYTMADGGGECENVSVFEWGTVPAELDYIEDKTRWFQMFGTPERAARTLENGTPLCSWCDIQTCDKKGGECSLLDYDVLLEWLRGDSE